MKSAKTKQLFFLVVIFICRVNLFASQPLQLTEKEKAWLNSHREIKVAPDPSFPPFEYFTKEGEYKGIASDFLKVIGKQLNVKFKVVKLKNWSEILKKIKNKEVDILGAAVPTTDRLKYLRFTKPIVEVPAVIITKKGKQVFKNISSLDGMTIIVVNNYGVQEYMRKNYKNIKLENVPDIIAGLRLLSFGRADAMVVNLASASYYVEKEGITNLRFLKDSGYIYDLSIAVRDDYPILVSILNKAMDSISSKKKKELLAPYFALERTEKGIRLKKEHIFFFAVSFIFIGIIVILFYNYSLRKEVAKKTEELERQKKELIAKLKENEEMREKVIKAKKMEVMGMLAGGVAHDLNNILTGVLTYPDILLMDMEKDHPYRKHLKIIKDSAERAAAIVKDLVTISKEHATEKSAVNIKKFIREYLNTPDFKKLRNEYPNVKVSTVIDKNLDNILGSKAHVEKIIANLTINAVEAIGKDNEKGLVKISAKNVFVSSHCEDFPACKPGNFVEIQIEDNGTGISKENLNKVFQPFFTTKFLGRSGTGLGLSVVLNTVINHNGSIKVNSDGKSFTKFTILLPSTKNKEQQEKQLKSLDELYGNQETILIVDDEVNQRIILEDLCKILNYKVKVARSGEEGIRLLKKYKADLVILDMLMPPGINGKETYKRMLKINPKQKAIISTGYSANKDVNETLKMGASAMLNKPYTVEKIGLAIKKALTEQ
jgi:signal transduction histidine kinase/ActR/RegA family two-component response regulator